MYHLQERSGVYMVYWILYVGFLNCIHICIPSTQLSVLYSFFSFTILMRLERERERVCRMDVLVVCAKKTFILFMYMPYMCPLHVAP